VVAEDPIKSQTEGLVKQYISQPDTVVVCVVAATLDSLSNSRSLALVNEANKARDMLLVLTKLDNVPVSGWVGG
jgi:GTP-binding protein EngB required for normal cell division